MRIYITKSTLIFLLAFSALSSITGQTSDSIYKTHLIHQTEFDISSGYIVQAGDFLRGNNQKNSKIDKSLSLHLKYGFQFPPNSYIGKMYPHTYQGIGISYNTFFDYSELGNPVAVYFYQGSRIKQISHKLSLDYEWNFGASFGWKHYDVNNNPYNTVVGSNINAYINLGLFLNWQMNQKWKFIAGVAATHYSNGNTHYPNSGINIIGTRIGFTRIFDTKNKKSIYSNENIVTHIKPHLIYDFIIFGATRCKVIPEENYAIPGSFGILGFNFNPMYNVNKYFKAGMSLDAMFDESSNIENHIAGKKENGDIIFYRPPLNERVSAGLSIRGEFVMPIFSINLGLGHNFIYKGKNFSGLYQVAVLKTSITRNLFLHIGYQLSEFKNPRNLMIGFGYHFHNKR
ncbi:MAG: acyloxyacyl hydrolase [Prevotella sp.]|nr:acyloxyacyl hydrolase [Prevotella sp.]